MRFKGARSVNSLEKFGRGRPMTGPFASPRFPIGGSDFLSMKAYRSIISCLDGPSRGPFVYVTSFRGPRGVYKFMKRGRKMRASQPIDNALPRLPSGFSMRS